MNPGSTSFNDHDGNETPLHHHRPFGAGIKRKRIDFVPASAPTSSTSSSTTSTTPKQNIGDLYLSIVQRNLPHPNPSPIPPPPDPELTQLTQPSQPPKTTPITHSPPNAPKQKHPTLTSLLTLPHHHPPSSIPRTSKALSYLSSYGWDPDNRVGLGAVGREGRLFPVRATERVDGDRRGIGSTLDEEEGEGMVREKGKGKVGIKVGKDGKEGREGKAKGEVKKRKLEEEEKERVEKLRRLVYEREEVNAYFGVEL